MPETIEIKATLEWRELQLFAGPYLVGDVIARRSPAQKWAGFLDIPDGDDVLVGEFATESAAKSAVVQALKNALGVKEP